MEPESDATKQRLREIVARYWVYWQVWPEWDYPEGLKTQVGFRLELCGTHPHGSQGGPGCKRCQEVYQRLQEIAAWIRPAGKRDSDYVLLSFDSGLHYGPSGQNFPDVTLTILIVHRSGCDRPVDACQVRCLREMEGRLRELGAKPSRPGNQRDSREASELPDGMLYLSGGTRPKKEQSA